MGEHVHEWRFDDRYPVIDTNPQILQVVCGCGATGEQTDGEDAVRDILEPEKVPDGEGSEKIEGIIQARPANRKVRKAYVKMGIKFLPARCAPVAEGGCGLAVLLSESGARILSEAEAEGKRFLVLCDGCVEKRGEVEYQEVSTDQMVEGCHVARILNVNERRN
jgi:hypothetical protein